MNNVIDEDDYTQVVAQLKLELKDLQKEYQDDQSLATYRTITDTDFGSIIKGAQVDNSLEQSTKEAK